MSRPLSPFGEGLFGMFMDAGAGVVFASALRDAEEQDALRRAEVERLERLAAEAAEAARPVRPAPDPFRLSQSNLNMVRVFLTFSDEELCSARNDDLAARAGMSYTTLARETVRKLIHHGIMTSEGMGKARRLKIDREKALQVLA